MDSHLAGVTHILRWLLGAEWSPASVCFKHPRPVSKTRYERFFRCPVDFLHEYNGVVLRRRDLDKKLPASSPVLRRQVERYIRTMNVGSSDAYVHQVTQIVAVALPRGEARADTIAGAQSASAAGGPQLFSGAGDGAPEPVEAVHDGQRSTAGGSGRAGGICQLECVYAVVSALIRLHAECLAEIASRHVSAALPRCPK
jgi:hypothetical protein